MFAAAKSGVKRFANKRTYPGRDVKRTEVRHPRTDRKGRTMKPMKAMRG